MPKGSSEKIRRAFGKVLRENRESKEVTQEELAERAELYRSYPSMIERGERQPTLGVVIRIADALGVEPEQLVAQTLEELEAGSRRK